MANFETELAALEAAVRQLESGNIPLEEAMAEYEKGHAALTRCREILAGARARVETLTGDKWIENDGENGGISPPKSEKAPQ